MGTTFNRKPQKPKRQYLRTHTTLAEKTLWNSLRRKQLHGFKFRRQHGIKKFIVDFYCPELQLAIEADGASHNTERARRNDQLRQQNIERHGIRFLRFTDDEIMSNPDRVVAKIEEEVMRLKSTTTPLSPPRGGGESDG